MKVELTDGKKSVTLDVNRLTMTVKLPWCDFCNCGTIPVKLLKNGKVKNACKCDRKHFCSKPYGTWTWKKI